MRLRAFGIAVLWAVSLVSVSVWAQGSVPDLSFGVQKQSATDGPAGLLTGADIGFVPSPGRTGRSAVAGRWMVRINGEWRETTSPVVVHPAQ